MSAEQLPDGLQLAVNVLLEESARNELIGAPESWNAELGGAIDAIRAEHAKRITLQHHAADQARRIANLETKCDTLNRLHDAAADERDALRARLAEIEAQEPVAWMRESGAEWLAVRGYMTVSGGCDGGWRSPLYARPIPAQAIPYELLKRCLLVMETNWTKIDGEWGPTDGGIEADIAAGYADEIRDLRKFLASAPEAAR